jgi:hypothetical protein
MMSASEHQQAMEYVANAKEQFNEFTTVMSRRDMATLMEFVDDSLSGRMLLGKFLLIKGSNQEFMMRLSNMLKEVCKNNTISVYDHLSSSDEAAFIVKVDKKILLEAPKIEEYEKKMIPGYGTNYVLIQSSRTISPGLANRAKTITVN